MRRLRIVCGVLWGVILLATPCLPADGPLKAFMRSPFSSELEIYSGPITGKSIGQAFDSTTRGDYGIRYTFGFMKAFNFSLNYMYSNQTRSFSAVTPASSGLPTGTAVMHAGNLNMAYGNGEWGLFHVGRSLFYLSPGVGYVRNGARSMTVVTPLGQATAPILPGGAVSFNLGAGIKFYPRKHFGIRLDARDYVSTGGTGDLNGPSSPVSCLPSDPTCTLGTVQRYFGPIPVQNNLVFTLGLIFKML